MRRGMGLAEDLDLQLVHRLVPARRQLRRLSYERCRCLHRYLSVLR